MNKETIYDSRISSLMTEIISVCKEANIAMFATFSIPTEDDDGLSCTTYLPDENGELPDHMKVCRDATLRNSRPTKSLMITVKKSDGSKTITAFL